MTLSSEKVQNYNSQKKYFPFPYFSCNNLFLSTITVETSKTLNILKPGKKTVFNKLELGRSEYSQDSTNLNYSKLEKEASDFPIKIVKI